MEDFRTRDQLQRKFAVPPCVTSASDFIKICFKAAMDVPGYNVCNVQCFSTRLDDQDCCILRFIFDYLPCTAASSRVQQRLLVFHCLDFFKHILLQHDIGDFKVIFMLCLYLIGGCHFSRWKFRVVSGLWNQRFCSIKI